MGISNFTAPKDDDDNNAASGLAGALTAALGGNAGPAGNGAPDVTDLLIDYNAKFKTASPALFREKIVEQALAVLIRRDKPNPLLVGPAGVGKTRIVEEVARLIATGSPVVPSALRDKTVYELPISSLVAGAGIVGQLEARVAGLVDFASDPASKAILFIDEIHVLADTRDPVYSKIAQILKPALARGEMHVIGATTGQEGRALGDDPAFQRRFARLIVDELTREQTVRILHGARGAYVSHHGNAVTVSDAMLETIAVVADETSRADQHRPDTAVTLMDQALADVVVAHSAAIAKAQASGNRNALQALQAMPVLSLTEAKLRSVALRLASGVAVKAQLDEQALIDSLAQLEGQGEAVAELLDALRRDRLGAFPRTRPVAWMLAGPSGSGKTETVKRIAAHLTGQEPIMLNMGEYAHAHDISKLVGAGPGYVGSTSNRELPFDTLESNPYRVILLDEIEKADRSVHRLLLTALDEGWMRMADGRSVDFSKATIVATTNAAREAIGKNPVGFQATGACGARLTQAQLASALKESFDAEFLGRFQKLLAYAPITREVYGRILGAAYSRERSRLLTESPRLGALVPDLDQALLEQTVQGTFLPEQGARPAERAARALVEDAIIAGQAASAAALTVVAQALSPAGTAAAQAQPVPGDDEDATVAADS